MQSLIVFPLFHLRKPNRLKYIAFRGTPTALAPLGAAWCAKRIGMDKSLIWLLLPGTFAVFSYLLVSARYRILSYDLSEYLLAGKRLSTSRFLLATTTITLLGVMSLPHTGLFYRSGFSYGFAALAAIIVPLTSALFAKRIWILGRIYNPLTCAQLLGDYYRCKGVRSVTALVAILVALTLSIMSLRFTTSLIEGFLGSGSVMSALTMGLMAVLLLYHSAYGGMGAIMRMAAPAGLALVMALIVAMLISIDALGGFSSFFDHLEKLQSNEVNAPLFAQGAFYDALPAAAPVNMAWPGSMVATALLALIGLATAPSAIMISFTPAKGQAHAPQQFFAAALMSGLVLFTTTIVIALAAHLSQEISGSTPSNIGNLADCPHKRRSRTASPHFLAARHSSWQSIAPWFYRICPAGRFGGQHICCFAHRRGDHGQ